MKAMPGKRIRRPFVPLTLILLMLLGIVVFLYSPIGVTRLRIQNNIFKVSSITMAEGEAGYKNVTQTIEARNPFFWPITVTKVRLHSKGEYSTVWGEVFADIPLTIQPGERKEINLTYQFDEDRFLTMYAESWFSERAIEVSDDPAYCIEDFLLSDGFIFYSGDIPTGEAYCFTENHAPQYIDRAYK